MKTIAVTPSLVTFQLILTVITLHLPTQISAGWWSFDSSSDQRLWSESGKKYLVYSIHYSLTGSPKHNPTLPKLKWRFPDWTRYLSFGWMSGYQGFLAGSNSKKKICLQCRDLGWISGLGRSPGKGNGNPLQYSCLENPMDKEPGRPQSIGSQRVGLDSGSENTRTAWSNSQINILSEKAAWCQN